MIKEFKKKIEENTPGSGYQTTDSYTFPVPTFFTEKNNNEVYILE